MPDPDLSLLFEQQKTILDRLGALEEGQTVLTGIAIRLEGAVQGMTLELRGLRSQLDRLATRHEETRAKVAALEGGGPAERGGLPGGGRGRLMW
jgi:hypothetical protein